jgi:hypothetical protein
MRHVTLKPRSLHRLDTHLKDGYTHPSTWSSKDTAIALSIDPSIATINYVDSTIALRLATFIASGTFLVDFGFDLVLEGHLVLTSEGVGLWL